MSVTIGETEDIETCRALRLEVFVLEQGVPLEEEFDALDEIAIHLLAMDDGDPVGTARLIVDGATGRIGRVCVLQLHRGTGLGMALVRAGMARLAREPGITRFVLSAQVTAQGFYEKLGFVAEGEPYLDAGIPHRDMWREATTLPEA